MASTYPHVTGIWFQLLRCLRRPAASLGVSEPKLGYDFQKHASVGARFAGFVHNKLQPADPTKYKEEASNHGYLVLRTMLLHGQAYPYIVKLPLTW